MKNVSAKLPLSITVPTTRRKDAIHSPSSPTPGGLPPTVISSTSSPSPTSTPPSPSAASSAASVASVASSLSSSSVVVNSSSHHQRQPHNHQHHHTIAIAPSLSNEKIEKFNQNVEVEKALIVKVGVLSLLWFISSVLTMYSNKYALATLDVSLVLLSTSQLVSTVCYGGLTVFIAKLYMPSSSSSATTATAITAATTTTTTTSVGASSSSSSSLFLSMYKEFVFLGVLRTLTVVLGLASYKYVAPSFTETIKATSPLFTVIFAWWILNERVGIVVALSLLPILVGLILCSIAELSFTFLGFAAAMINNIFDCLQNVLSKKLLVKSISFVELQFFTSVAAVPLQLTAWFIMSSSGIFDGEVGYQPHSVSSSVAVNSTAVPQPVLQSFFRSKELLDSIRFDEDTTRVLTLFLNGVSFHLQSMLAYAVLSYVSPITLSVLGIVKRAGLIWTSVLLFGNPVSLYGKFGTAVVIMGVLCYHLAKHQNV